MDNPKSSIPISAAFLHQSITVPGSGMNGEKSLSASKIPGIKMLWVPQGLLCELKGKRALVPSANVVVAILEDKPKE